MTMHMLFYKPCCKRAASLLAVVYIVVVLGATLLPTTNAFVVTVTPSNTIARLESATTRKSNHNNNYYKSSMTCLYGQQQSDNDNNGGGFMGAISNFFDELDAFVDDATSRRLGAGSAFYGKRKSSFYGKNDSNKKVNPNTPDPTEDYQGPAKAGYFQWMQDEETGEMKPVTRMKKQNIERNPNYWDRAFGNDD